MIQLAEELNDDDRAPDEDNVDTPVLAPPIGEELDNSEEILEDGSADIPIIAPSVDDDLDDSEEALDEKLCRYSSYYSFY